MSIVYAYIGIDTKFLTVYHCNAPITEHVCLVRLDNFSRVLPSGNLYIPNFAIEIDWLPAHFSYLSRRVIANNV